VTPLFRLGNTKDPEAALEKFSEFDKKYPELSKIPYFTGTKLNLLLQAKKTDDAKKMAEKVLKGAKDYDDTITMHTVSFILRSAPAKANKDLLALSLKAAETMLESAGDKDVNALLNMAETRLARGESDKAKAQAEKALELATEILKKIEEHSLKAGVPTSWAGMSGFNPGFGKF